MWPGGRSSGIVLGTALSGRYVITDALSGELTAEIDKRPGRALRLALDPGRYLIRKPEGAFVAVGELTVLPNGAAAVDESDFERVPYTDVARRGASSLRLWSIDLAGGVGTGTVAGNDPIPRMGVSLGRELGPWALSGGVEFGADAFRGQQLEITQSELWGFVDARLRMPLSWALPYIGARAAFGWIHQAFERDQERVIREVLAMNEMPSRDGSAGQLLLGLGLELPWSRVVLRVEAFGGATASRVDAELRARPMALVRIATGWRF